MTRGSDNGLEMDDILLTTSPAEESGAKELANAADTISTSETVLDPPSSTQTTTCFPPLKSPTLDSLRFLLKNCTLGRSSSVSGNGSAPAPVLIKINVNDSTDSDSSGATCESTLSPIKTSSEESDGENQDPSFSPNMAQNEDLSEGNHAPEATRKRRSHLISHEQNENEEEEFIGRRRTRLSLSKFRNNQVDSSGPKTRSSATLPPVTPGPLVIKNCWVKLYRCDYQLRVYSQFNFTPEPCKADQKNLIKSLEKLKGILKRRQEWKKKVRRSKANKRASIQLDKSLSLPTRLLPSRMKLQQQQKKKALLRKILARSRSKLLRKKKQLQLRKKGLKVVKGRKRVHPCQLCDKSFFTRSHLYNHLRIHTGEKSYKCDVCQKAFTQKGALVLHMRTHSRVGAEAESGNKKEALLYKCSKCDKTFSSYLQRNIHVRKHLAVRRLLYRCSICGKCCSSIRLLKLHCLNSHSPEDIQTVPE